jgi:hypothetical protein
MIRSDIDLKQLPADETDVTKIVAQYNKLINYLNFFNKSISLQSNFNGYIAEVKIDAGASVKIQHFLGVKPKWRIILKQTGNGVITDIPEEWSENVISLKNNGVESVIVSVFIVRE